MLQNQETTSFILQQIFLFLSILFNWALKNDAELTIIHQTTYVKRTT